MLAAGFAVRDGRLGVQAADDETITWGATDPSWSPDGEFLAFSLFGSIWKIPARGGVAEQITSSAGYHAHPAWSPRGDRIAFIRGRTPQGRTPNVPGTLALVDAGGGSEREVATPHPVAGRIAWSPEAKQIVCALNVPGGGSLLHDIDLETSVVRQLQHLPRRGAPEPWVDTAWSGPRAELYFTARRGGPTQVWSMPVGKPRFLIQLPLTKYREGDIALLDSLSAFPDGSSIVYSAVLTNGRGNYELYKVPATGGEPVALTDTERDEFSPAISPDGARIAHVSNHLGNIDLFVMPAAGGAKQHVRIESLKFQQPSGQVRVRVLDELGEPTAVRLYVRASDGKAYYPSGTPVYYYPLDPGGEREGFFIASGDNTFPAPPGPLRLVALKGVEYRIAERTATVSSGQTTEVTIQLERWTNWAQRGWYTGDNHFHANYNGSYYQRPLQSLRWLDAVDLNYGNMVVANSEGGFIHDKEFFRGAQDPLSTARRVLYWGQEYRNTDPLGHMGFLGIRSLVMPSYTSVAGSDSPYDYPLNTMAAQNARGQGGLVTYMHPMAGSQEDVFDGNYNAREAPVTAALGALDAVDVLPLFGGQPYALWYTLLNAGFRLSPGAGTDTFTNYRGITRLPGMAREYVEVGTAFDSGRFLERYRQGRNFVTNGPLLSFTVNGQAMGSVINAADTPYRVRLAAEVSSIMPLATMEFVQNGEVIETRQIGASQQTERLEKEVMVTRGSWFAARVSGRPARGVPDDGIPRVHSGPIYVQTGGKPVLVKADVELMIRWVERLWLYLERRDNFGSEDNKTRARRMFEQALEHYRVKLAQAG